MLHYIPFVNRIEELKVLEELSARGLTKPLYLYGPEGCGKTRLLKEFINSYNDVGVYIDALEGGDVESALQLSKVLNRAIPLIGELVESYSGSVGRILAERIHELLRRLIVKLSLRKSRLVVVVDDVVKAIGIDRIEWYIKWLYELIWKIREKYEVKSILIIVTTSEGLSLDIVSRHTHSHIRMLWNLDKKAFLELASKLNPPDTATTEEVWRVTGGNPRAVIEIAIDYNWDVSKWLVDLKYRLLRVVERVKHRQLAKHLRTVIEDVDVIHSEFSEEMYNLYKVLVEENLIIYKYMNMLVGRELVENQELGIGKYYAWQIPAYRKVLSQLL